MQQRDRGPVVRDRRRSTLPRWVGVGAVAMVLALPAVVVPPLLPRAELVALLRGAGIAGIGFAVLAGLGRLQLSRRYRTAAALDRALTELAEAHAELGRRQSFTDALLETIEVGIVSCDADGVFVVSNRAERAMFGLATGLEGLGPEDLPSLIDVFDTTGRNLSASEYPLMRALRGEVVAHEDVLVGPVGGPWREIVVHGSQIVAADGTVLGAVAALTDVSAERAARRALAEERRKLAEAQELGQLGGFEYDMPTGRWTFSDELCALWGVHPGRLSAARCFALVVDDDLDRIRATWDAIAVIPGRHTDEFRIRRASDRTERVIRARTEILVDADGVPSRIRGSHIDITDVAVAERAARRANAFSDAVLAASPDNTLVTDVATGAILFSSPGKRLLGMRTETFTNVPVDTLAEHIHPDDRERLSVVHAAARELADGESRHLRYRARDTDGRWRWLDHTATPFRRDATGAVVEVLAVLRDVTDVVEAEEQLTHAAHHDNLTGLPNRAFLLETLEGALARSRVDGRDVAVLFCDLDGFKEVNDTGGHSAGDAVLRETAQRFREVLREGDTVARVGGDEFVIVVEPWKRADPGPSLPAGESARALAVDVAERLTRAPQKPITVRGLDHVVRASIGITYATLDPAGAPASVTVDEVLHRADGAMYRAKDRGGSRYELDDTAPW
ncbi:putative diguanylate cyclase YegE [mine drainage metagenome]|uniref:Putative diguanylate cyclase YegE n=1 Tax=mine drainage metagenome TaxID=410659 RepID=A0A1J5R3F9_9ZZZZ